MADLVMADLVNIAHPAAAREILSIVERVTNPHSGSLENLPVGFGGSP